MRLKYAFYSEHFHKSKCLHVSKNVKAHAGAKTQALMIGKNKIFMAYLCIHLIIVLWKAFDGKLIETGITNKQ